MELEKGLKEYYNFTEDDLKTTFEYFKPELIAAKSYFLKEGKILDKIGFVKSGMFRSFFVDYDANDITTHFFLPGTVLISIDSFNKQIPSKESIIALEDSELLTATYNDMAELAQKVPAWKSITVDTDQYKYREQMNRAIRFQTLSASERYQQLLEKRPAIVQKVPLRHIASYLGIDIATLSRIRKKI